MFHPSPPRSPHSTPYLPVHSETLLPQSSWQPRSHKVVFSADKPPKSVNELLANLRRTAIGPSAAASSAAAAQPTLAATTPSVPPAIREILQLPDTPAPAPRRLFRSRFFDGNGRRLPAGPPPPRSWVVRRLADRGSSDGSSSRSTRLSAAALADAVLPGIYLPARGSLLDIVLHKLACDWEVHREYNQFHLYFMPTHLKPALIRYVGIASEDGISLTDLKSILLPPPDTFDPEEEERLKADAADVVCLDLSGSIGRSLRLKEVADLLFPTKGKGDVAIEPQESWDVAEAPPSPPRGLTPNLTHLSLAVDPRYASRVSWKQLLSLSAKLPSLTHLSLAYWPDPCLTPGARRTSVASPQGNIPYGGTNIYSHSIDHDWSEALLVLRTLSRNLYRLEFLDLTGCGPWFTALMAESEHDFVDWVGDWGKVTELRLLMGWRPGDDAAPSDHQSFREGIQTARNVERHIRAARAGQGRFIAVEKDRLEL